MIALCSIPNFKESISKGEIIGLFLIQWNRINEMVWYLDSFSAVIDLGEPVKSNVVRSLLKSISLVKRPSKKEPCWHRD